MATAETKTATPPQGNTGRPAGNAPTADEAAETARETAAAAKAEAKADLKAASSADSLAGRAPVGLGPRVTHDVIGRKLPTDDQARRLQQREATLIRQQRVDEDVNRVNHGLAPKWAATELED